MKMARAFIAAVPLALALVAAVIVPLALIPGTFGFHGWPRDRTQHVAAAPVDVAPDALPVARSGRVHASRDTLASTRRSDTPSRTLAAAPATGRNPAGSAETPATTAPPGSGRGDHADGLSPAFSAPADPAPSAGQDPPAAGGQPAQPATEIAAGGEVPVLRDEPAAASAAPPPAPVVVVAAPAPAPVPAPDREEGAPQRPVVGFVVGLLLGDD